MKRALSWSSAVSCLLAAGLLAACDARQWPLADYRSGQPNATAWRQPAQTSKSNARSGHREAPAARPAPAGGAEASANGAAIASTAPPPPIESNSSDVALIGLNMEQARDRLGSPTEEIERAPAKVWRYRTPQCSVDLSLYPDVHTQVFRVLNYEVKSNDGTEQGRRKCIAGLRSGSVVR